MRENATRPPHQGSLCSGVCTSVLDTTLQRANRQYSYQYTQFRESSRRACGWNYDDGELQMPKQRDLSFQPAALHCDGGCPYGGSCGQLGGAHLT